VLIDAEDYRALAAWAETYADPEFHRQMAAVARSPHESIADDELDREIERIRRGQRCLNFDGTPTSP
jgi:hypothetical protein